MLRSMVGWNLAPVNMEIINKKALWIFMMFFKQWISVSIIHQRYHSPTVSIPLETLASQWNEGPDLWHQRGERVGSCQGVASMRCKIKAPPVDCHSMLTIYITACKFTYIIWIIYIYQIYTYFYIHILCISLTTAVIPKIYVKLMMSLRVHI